MMKRMLTLGVVAVTLAMPALSAAQRGRNDQRSDDRNEKGPWIHVEVTEEGEETAKVTVNLPLSLARVALEMAPEDVLEHGRIEFNDHELTVGHLEIKIRDRNDLVVKNLGDILQ